MTTRPVRASRPLAEALTAGLAYAMTLLWLSVCALGVFRPNFTPIPYWPGVLGLRSDTAGALAFAVAAVCLVTSEYLRLRRRAADPAIGQRRLADHPPMLFVVAVAETVAVLSTGLVIYLSANAVAHPETLIVQATHLTPWPDEGTLRIIALAGCAVSVAVLRYLLAGIPLWRSIHRRETAASSDREPSGAGFMTVPPSDGNGATISPVASRPVTGD